MSIYEMIKSNLNEDGIPLRDFPIEYAPYTAELLNGIRLFRKRPSENAKKRHEKAAKDVFAFLTEYFAGGNEHYLKEIEAVTEEIKFCFFVEEFADIISTQNVSKQWRDSAVSLITKSDNIELIKIGIVILGFSFNEETLLTDIGEAFEILMNITEYNGLALYALSALVTLNDDYFANNGINFIERMIFKAAKRVYGRFVINDEEQDNIERVTLKIHRGTHQIGGCVTEISTKTSKVFIDIGENLNENGAKLPPIRGLTSLGGDPDKTALFLTHYHGDHIGMLGEVNDELPVYIGETAKAILLNYAERIKSDELPIYRKINTFKPLQHITVGDITVTPILADHSALDSYMFVIETGGKRILHTGDFRFHGFHGAELDSYVKNIDYIICEGTTVSRNGEPPMTELQLQEKAAELMKTEKYVFVVCSSTNIDRIGAFYHANPKGRLFVCDKYQKKQLKTARENKSDSDFYDFKHIYDYAKNLDNIMEEKGFCMIVRQGELFRRVMEKYKYKCLVIYSMWTGYLDERALNHGLVDLLAPYNYRVLHTSGHASAEDIKRIYETVAPMGGIIPIHTDAPEKFRELLPDANVIILKDGERLLI